MHSELQNRFPHAAYIHPSAHIYGNVEIGEGASLWPCAVVRAESRLVRIGRYTNLQDHVMLHVGYHAPTIVGDYCSITHRVVLHGCTIGDNCLIGIGATVMEGAVIGENSIVAGHSFVADNTIVPPNSIVMGTPAKVAHREQLRRQPGQRHAVPPQCAGLRQGRSPRLGRAGVRGGDGALEKRRGAGIRRQAGRMSAPFPT
jgi:carbonic anhydrase/acetyltransferase-like protein (isoleucine patch superfamily)